MCVCVCVLTAFRETSIEEVEVLETFLQEYAVFRISKYVDQSGSIERMEESKEEESRAVVAAKVRQALLTLLRIVFI